MQYIAALLAIKPDGSRKTHFNQMPVKTFEAALSTSSQLLGSKMTDPNIATMCRLEGYKVVTCVITDDDTDRTGYLKDVYEPGQFPTYIFTRADSKTALMFITKPTLSAL